MTTKTKASATKKNSVEIPVFGQPNAAMLAQTTDEATRRVILREIMHYPAPNDPEQDRVTFIVQQRIEGHRDPEAFVQTNYSYSWNEITREQLAQFEQRLAQSKGQGAVVDLTLKATPYLGGKEQIVWVKFID